MAGPSWDWRDWWLPAVVVLAVVGLFALARAAGFGPPEDWEGPAFVERLRLLVAPEDEPGEHG